MGPDPTRIFPVIRTCNGFHLAFDLKTIEALAPDQASLGAASKLTKRSNWVRLECHEGLMWGECQGSGSNPYRVVVDAGDQGYKCTCPSRKFPCKHSLALMWIDATAPTSFTPTTDIPEWVNDWLGRRRRPTSGAPAAASGGAAKSIGEAQAVAEEAKPEDPAASAKREAAQKKRAEETKTSIAAGLDELDQWISDQLRLGLSAFVDNASDRCRRIASRLVDAKAAGSASRLDELPSTLLQLASEERPEAVIRELGKLVLLTKAWRTSPDDPELKRLVGSPETRDQILANPDAPSVKGTWEVMGERIETRKDGLVSHATWLLQVATDAPRFAVLLDFYPASAGKRSQAFSPGERFVAELVYYPARAPLRALVMDRGPASANGSWPHSDNIDDPLAAHQQRQDAAPWTAETPLVLPKGRLARDDSGKVWWQAEQATNGIALPVAGDVPEPVFGMTLEAATGLWNGARLELLTAYADHGRLDLA